MKYFVKKNIKMSDESIKLFLRKLVSKILLLVYSFSRIFFFVCSHNFEALWLHSIKCEGGFYRLNIHNS